MRSHDAVSEFHMTPQKFGGQKLGVLGLGFVDWGGGLDFLRLVLDGLLDGPDRQPIVLLLPKDGPRSRVRNWARSIWSMAQSISRGSMPRFVHIRRPSPDTLRSYFADYVGRIDIRFYEDSPRGLEVAVSAAHVSQVVPVCGTLGRSFRVPWVGYIYDFQHKYFPVYFAPLERIRRDRWLQAVLNDASVVMVNAKAVKDDVRKYYPKLAGKVRVLPFTPRTKAHWFEPESKVVAQRYGLGAPYFIVCNQFWIHKDHETAIRALRLFTDRAKDHQCLLVCTGNMEDPRRNGYAQSLVDLIATMDLERRVRFLGRVEKNDQMALIRGAEALVQPTLFEGGPGGGACYDAIAVGTPALISDIPVNREIDCGTVDYFKAGDPASLAEAMWRLRVSPPARPDLETLLRESGERNQKLHQSLMSMLAEARIAR